MNERIRELAKQCTSWSEGSTWTSREIFDKEKFAEFIIQDILTVVKSEHKLALEFQWDADDTAIAIRDAIKKRFGVEE